MGESINGTTASLEAGSLTSFARTGPDGTSSEPEDSSAHEAFDRAGSATASGNGGGGSMRSAEGETSQRSSNIEGFAVSGRVGVDGSDESKSMRSMRSNDVRGASETGRAEVSTSWWAGRGGEGGRAMRAARGGVWERICSQESIGSAEGTESPTLCSRRSWICGDGVRSRCCIEWTEIDCAGLETGVDDSSCVK